jgi:hypothetical protein
MQKIWLPPVPGTRSPVSCHVLHGHTATGTAPQSVNVHLGAEARSHRCKLSTANSGYRSHRSSRTRRIMPPSPTINRPNTKPQLDPLSRNSTSLHIRDGVSISLRSLLRRTNFAPVLFPWPFCQPWLSHKGPPSARRRPIAWSP